MPGNAEREYQLVGGGGGEDTGGTSKNATVCVCVYEMCTVGHAVEKLKSNRHVWQCLHSNWGCENIFIISY